MRDDGRVVAIQDFAAHVRFARDVWRGEADGGEGSVYSVQFHRRVIERWVGASHETGALPFGYAPTMLWLLGLLVLIPLPVAYLVWTAAGLVAAGGLVVHRRTRGTMTLAACLSPVALSAIAVGQTAFLTVFALLVLMDRSLGAPSERGARDVAVCAAVLWLLTAKPPLALVAGGALWALDRPRPVAAAAAAAAVTTILLTPWLGGPSWPGEYLRLLSVYDTGEAAPLFATSLDSSMTTMNNLRAFLHVNAGLPDHVLARGTTVLWLASLGGVVVAGRRGLVGDRVVWALVVLSYLILCPHVSATDDLHLLLVPAALAAVNEGAAGGWRGAMPWLVVLIGLVLGGGPQLLGGLRPSPMFLIKVAMAILVLRMAVAEGERTGRAARARAPGR